MAANFAKETSRYYRWLEQGWQERPLTLERDGLALKRDKMAGIEEPPPALFAFLRGTIYLWRGQFATVAQAVRDAPALLAPGDVHLENFGTWRDAEGRLVWGLNDLDEATTLPFTADLVRLMTSLLAARHDKPKHLVIAPAEAAAAILKGYRDAIEGGTPFVLESQSLDLIRRAALADDKPAKAWAKLQDPKNESVPQDDALRHLLLTCLPQGAVRPVFYRLQKGLGSLGRPRWMVIADWHGSPVAREAKATAPSGWLSGEAGVHPSRDQRRLAAEARRATDPGFLVTRDWVVRRISPEMRKIELKDLRDAAAGGDSAAAQTALLRAMGGEVANLHAGTAPDRAALLAWLDARDALGQWLLDAAETALRALVAAQAEFLADPNAALGA